MGSPGSGLGCPNASGDLGEDRDPVRSISVSWAASHPPGGAGISPQAGPAPAARRSAASAAARR